MEGSLWFGMGWLSSPETRVSGERGGASGGGQGSAAAAAATHRRSPSAAGRICHVGISGASLSLSPFCGSHCLSLCVLYTLRWQERGKRGRRE